MLKYNNSHIFTGYIKQLLSSVNLPACKIYTREFADYVRKYGKEDPRILESFDNLNKDRLAVNINYLKNDNLCSYFSKSETDLALSKASWQTHLGAYYDSEKSVPGLTRNLNSPSNIYDTATHEYLGDYLRFLRDYHNINLMSLYNCFTDKIYNNVFFDFTINPDSTKSHVKAHFNTLDSKYKIYALPVKLFAEYTIAVDSSQGIEVFCGLYNTNLDQSAKAAKLAAKTYQKFNKTLFNQPILYNKLSLENWSKENDFVLKEGQKRVRTDTYTRWDITMREHDLRLFIKVPVSCQSSITILEGDFRDFNNSKFAPDPDTGNLVYQNNRSILNFNNAKRGDNVDLNNYTFKPISKLQLLALNTGESYPFADRLIEYLSGSAITPIDEIADNIKRVQRVMCQNNNYFKIEGLWENKMQNLLYDYVMNSGPVKVVTVGNDKTDPNTYNKEVDTEIYKGPTRQALKDSRQGRHPRQGYAIKSTLYDVLGYADKDTEKLYANWKLDGNKAKVGTSLQTVDIYNGLYDI